MKAITSFFSSSIGKKTLMGLSGAGLIGFIIAHLLGNLLVFLGPEALNNYAKGLHDLGGLLWVARIGLIAIFVTHIVTAIQVSRGSKAARPNAYKKKKNIVSSRAATTMGISGTFILFFVVGHLAHFTLGYIQPEYSNFVDSAGRHDVYRMIVSGFSEPIVSIPYIFALILVGAHLSHGITSFFQTLGFNHPTYTPIIKKVGPLLAIAITIGYLSIPVSVLSGIIKL